MAKTNVDLNLLNDAPPWEWPQNAGKTLKRILGDRRAAESDRYIAARLAGDLVVMDDEMAGLLLDIVARTEEPAKLRALAATALGAALEDAFMEGFDDDDLSEASISEETFHRIQETLQRVFLDQSEPKQVRRRVLEASVRAPEDWHEPAIRAADSSGDAEWALTAAFAMRWVPGFDQRILELLKSPNEDIHYEAVCAAGTREVKAAWPHVAGLLESPKTAKQLKLAAIETAGYIGRDQARPLLCDLAGSKDEEIAEAAADALMIAEQDFDEDEYEEDDDSPR